MLVCSAFGPNGPFRPQNGQDVVPSLKAFAALKEDPMRRSDGATEDPIGWASLWRGARMVKGSEGREQEHDMALALGLERRMLALLPYMHPIGVPPWSVPATVRSYHRRPREPEVWATRSIPGAIRRRAAMPAQWPKRFPQSR